MKNANVTAIPRRMPTAIKRLFTNSHVWALDKKQLKNLEQIWKNALKQKW